MAEKFDLEAFVPFRLNRAAELVSLGFAAQYQKTYGMTRPEWRALAALGNFGRMTATEIGRHSKMHKTKVSRAVQSMEERRWLRREDDPDDRRVEHLELTPLGLKFYREIVVLARAYETEILKRLGKSGLLSLEAGLDAIEAAYRD